MFSYALGGVELDVMLASRHAKAAVVLSIVYQFAMVMVLMNLLIGIMTTSLNKVCFLGYVCNLPHNVFATLGLVLRFGF